MFRRARKPVCLLIVAMFAFNSILISNARANQAGSNIKTQVLLLNSAGTDEQWHNTVSLNAKLVSSPDNQPISGQNLSLYVNESAVGNGGKWTLLVSNSTGEDGIATFSFYVNMTDGTYNYTIIYMGQDPYLPASIVSYFIVVGDATGTISITISNVKCSVDKGISLSISVIATSPGSYWEGIPLLSIYHTSSSPEIWSSYLSVQLKLYIKSMGGLQGTWTFYPFGQYSPQISQGINGLWNYTINGDTANLTGVFSTDNISPFSFPFLLWGNGLDYLGWNPSNDNFTVTVSATSAYNDTAYYPFYTPTSQVLLQTTNDTTITSIYDPDTTPPSLISNTGSGAAVKGSNKSYILNFEYSDAYGWTGNVQYKFYNGTTYSSVVTINDANSTTSTSSTTLQYGIPYATWSAHPGEEIYFRTQAIDNFEPQTYQGGRLVTNWSSVSDPWTDAGRIYKNVGGDIASVQEWGQDGSNTWIDGMIGSGSLFSSMYVGDRNFIAFEIANPTSSPIIISNPELTLSANFGFTTINIPLGTSSGLPANLSIPIGVNQYSITTTANAFDQGAFPSADWSRGDTPQVTIKFSFTYGTNVSGSVTYNIVPPSEPTVTFIGYTGTQEGGNFILKTADGAAATVHAQFLITNNARIPITTVTSISSSSIPSGMTIVNNVYESNASIPGLASTTISFPLQLDPTFFTTLGKYLSLILGGVVVGIGNTWKYILTAINVGLNVQKAATISAYVNGVLDFFLGAFQGALCLLAGLTYEGEKTFSSTGGAGLSTNTSWMYTYHDTSKTASTAFNYPDKVKSSSSLTATPSNTQGYNYLIGLGEKLLAVSLYIVGGLFCFEGPIGVAIGAIMATGATILASVADYTWSIADDDITPSTNYTSVYTPVYQTMNTTAIKPNSEFNADLLALTKSSAMLSGDLKAINETVSRQEGAVNAGDYSAAVTQDDALANYTQMAAGDYSNVQNDLGVMSTIIAQNSSEIVDSTRSVETSIAGTGLTPSDINALQNAGLNQSGITALNKSIINITRSGVLSGWMPAFISNMTSAFNASVPFANKEIARLEYASSTALLNATALKVEKLGMCVTTADDETLSTLYALNSTMEGYYLASDWTKAAATADQLISLARKTTASTNNQSYMLTFGNDAQMTKQNALQNLALTVVHVTRIEVTPGKPQTITLVVLSEGAPSGTYLFETNSSWVGPNDTSIVVTRFNSNDIELQISVGADPFTIPGTYPVDLRVSLPGTRTVIDSVLLVKVINFHRVMISVKPSSSSIYPGDNGNYICSVRNVGNVLDSYQVRFKPGDFAGVYQAYPTSIQQSWCVFNDTGIAWDSTIAGWDGIFALNPGQNKSFALIITIPVNWIGFEDATYTLNMNASLVADSMINNEASLTLTVISTLTSMKNYVSWEINQLNAAIQASSYSQWVRPWYKCLVSWEVDMVSWLFDNGYTSLAHDDLLYTIRPWLAGSTTSQHGKPWDHCTCKDSLITDPNLRSILVGDVDSILTHVMTYQEACTASAITSLGKEISALGQLVNQDLTGSKKAKCDRLLTHVTTTYSTLLSDFQQNGIVNYTAINKLQHDIVEIKEIARNSAITKECNTILGLINTIANGEAPCGYWSWNWYWCWLHWLGDDDH